MDKKFLTYDQQMEKIQNTKKITCSTENDKILLCRNGYFNLINGYKYPFVNKTDPITKEHIYYPGISIQMLASVKSFDDNLRMLLIRYITKVEEEVRTIAGYKFDEVNCPSNVCWYDVKAYNSNFGTFEKIIPLISKSYQEINNSKLDYLGYIN